MNSNDEYPEWLIEWRTRIKRVLRDYSSIIQYLYFEYFDNEKDPSIEGFKDHMLEITDAVIDRIHDKYADHVEGRRKEKGN
jgi:hypothetical protein